MGSFVPGSHGDHGSRGDRGIGESLAKLLLEATASPACTISSSRPSIVEREAGLSISECGEGACRPARVVVNFGALSFILGLGYVMGLRSSMILCAGGVLSNLVLVPLIWMIGEIDRYDRGAGAADTGCFLGDRMSGRCLLRQRRRCTR